MLPKPDELSAVQAAKERALKEHQAKVAAMASASGSSSAAVVRVGTSQRSSSESLGSSRGAGEGCLLPPRLGVVEAAFEALGGVKMLMAKMRACEFK